MNPFKATKRPSPQEDLRKRKFAKHIRRAIAEVKRQFPRQEDHLMVKNLLKQAIKEMFDLIKIEERDDD
jgi:hypothetical protein